MVKVNPSQGPAKQFLFPLLNCVFVQSASKQEAIGRPGGLLLLCLCLNTQLTPSDLISLSQLFEKPESRSVLICRVLLAPHLHLYVLLSDPVAISAGIKTRTLRGGQVCDSVSQVCDSLGLKHKGSVPSDSRNLPLDNNMAVDIKCFRTRR